MPKVLKPHQFFCTNYNLVKDNTEVKPGPANRYLLRKMNLSQSEMGIQGLSLNCTIRIFVSSRNAPGTSDKLFPDHLPIKF